MLQTRIKHPLTILIIIITLVLSIRSFTLYAPGSSAGPKKALITATDQAQQIHHKPKDNGRLVAGTILTVCSANDIQALVESVISMEYRFNGKYHYDWVFLNADQVEFDDTFKELLKGIVTGQAKFGVVDSNHWGFPKDTNIDADKSLLFRSSMEKAGIKDGFGLEGRHRTRYWVKFFQDHELLRPYDYYWRVEPGMKMLCDVNYDVFKFMQNENKVFGFLASYKEGTEVLPSLWSTVKEYLVQNPEIEVGNVNYRFLESNELGQKNYGFSTCAFYQDLEIGDLNYFRSNSIYKSFVDYIDHSNGIYYEKWSDSIIRTIALSLTHPWTRFHVFSDIGYATSKSVVHTCPVEKSVRWSNRCNCNEKQNVLWNPKYCIHRYFILNDIKRPEGWEYMMNRNLQAPSPFE